MFHQSGGCCDNSAANCYLPGEITIGAGDESLGDIGGCPFYIGKSQYEYWKHTQLIIDVIDGHGGTFSLEGPEGKAFHTRSRVSPKRSWQSWTRPNGGAPDPARASPLRSAVAAKHVEDCPRLADAGGAVA